jgi:hypothetical protein
MSWPMRQGARAAFAGKFCLLSGCDPGGQYLGESAAGGGTASSGGGYGSPDQFTPVKADEIV